MARVGAAGPVRYERGEAAIAVFGTWMITGLFLDGWAHNVDKPETFFTPWHGLLYSGFVAAVLWFIWDGRRQVRAGVATPADPGDRLTTVGLVIFIVGAAGDGVWHEVFGIEVNLAALLSPTHLLLLIGGFLMVTTPIRGAWRDPDVRAPSFRSFFPQIVTLTLATALVLFFTQYLSAFEGVARHHLFTGRDKELREVEGLASVLATNLVFMFTVVFTVRRLRPPFGTFTVLFPVVAVYLTGLNGFDLVELALPALVAGVAADLLVTRGRPILVFGVVPVVLWSAFFATAEVSYGVGWDTELWAGSIVLASMTGLLLGALTSDTSRLTVAAATAASAPATATTSLPPVAASESGATTDRP
jgi:hypothetical protein